MKKILFIIALSASMLSCRKFLKEYSPSDVTPTLTSEFGEILFSDGYPDKQTIARWIHYLSDDIQCYYGPANVESLFYLENTKNLLQWQADLENEESSFKLGMDFNTWARYYSMLLGVNVVIDHLDGSTGSQADKEQFKGEAYALRAFYHFMLVNLYGRPFNDSTTTPDKSLGVPIRTNSNLSDDYLGRNTVAEVYDQVVRDLDSAIVLLEKQNRPKNVFRISATAAHLLASRVYLYMENWDKAIYHADEVLKHHSALMDYNDWVGVEPTEENQILGLDNVESIWCYGHTKEQYPEGFSYIFDISGDLYQCFEANDLRKTVTIFEVPAFLKLYVVPDYIQRKIFSNATDAAHTINVSWRSAEAYLNRAEAYIQLYRTKGDVAAAEKALQSLNTLRERRFAFGTFQPWTVEDGDVMLQKCRDERRRELFGEESHRWFDLRRYGMPSIKHNYFRDLATPETYTLQKRDPQYVIPIPREVIDMNPVLEQNPLYPGIRMPD